MIVTGKAIKQNISYLYSVSFIPSVVWLLSAVMFLAFRSLHDLFKEVSLQTFPNSVALWRLYSPSSTSGWRCQTDISTFLKLSDRLSLSDNYLVDWESDVKSEGKYFNKRSISKFKDLRDYRTRVGVQRRSDSPKVTSCECPGNCHTCRSF